MTCRNYTDLIAWQKAMDFVHQIYCMTAAFPGDERFGLTSQLRRAAVSIPSNIAEGQGRESPGDFIRFLAIAHGSLREVETQLRISQRLGYPADDQLEDALESAGEVGRLVTGLKNALLRRTNG